MWHIHTMAMVWGLGGLAGAFGWTLWGYLHDSVYPLAHHPGFFAWPGVFASAALGVSHWVPVGQIMACGALYSLGWLALLEQKFI